MAEGSLTQTKGVRIPVQNTVNEILCLRAEQVGARYSDAAVEHCRGRWKNNPHVEPVVECSVVHGPFPGEGTPKGFERDMGLLAEQVAELIGQGEMGQQQQRPAAHRAARRPGVGVDEVDGAADQAGVGAARCRWGGPGAGPARRRGGFSVRLPPMGLR